MGTTEEIGLKIMFDYLNGNDAVLELIKHLADKHGIRGYLEKKEDTVYVIISAPLEKLQNFSKELGEKLPYSIFMTEASTQPIESLPEYISDRFKIKEDLNIIPQNKGLCPSCLKELLSENSRRYHFPFISCNYCGSHYSYLYGYPFERERTVFKFFQMCSECEKEYNHKNSFRYKHPLTACHNCLTPIYLRKGENERYGFDSEKTAGAFNTASGIIEKGNLIRIYTSYGQKVIGMITEENVAKICKIKRKKPLTVLFTGIENLDKYLILSDLEKRILLSQEKPVLKVKPSNQFEEKSLVSPFEFIKVKLPDDPVLVLLSFHLKNRGIDYILVENLPDEDSSLIAEFELNADLPVVNLQQETKIILIDKYVLIEKGEKGILPNIIKSKATGNLSIAGDYAALDLGDGEYLIDRKEKLLPQLKDFVNSINQLSILAGETSYIEVPYKEKKEFQSYQGAILSVMAEHKILNEPVIGLYFSHTNDSVIGVKSRTKPLTSLISVKPVKVHHNFLETVKWILQEIQENSPEGERLIKNFSQKYPHIWESLQQPQHRKNSFKIYSSLTPVFNTISFILELFSYSEAEYYTEPYLYLQSEALKFKGKKGVKIDYFLDETDNQFQLNWIKTVQSVISYKLAGAEADMLAFSLLEGFGDWLVSQLSTIKSKLKIDNIVLSGNMFTDPVIAGKLINFASKDGNLFINKKLPIDNQNICLGGIFV